MGWANDEIIKGEVRSTTTLTTPEVADCSQYNYCALWVFNSLNASVEIQAYGNIAPGTSNGVMLGDAIVVDTTNRSRAHEIPWAPFVYATVTALTTPTSGEIDIRVIRRADNITLGKTEITAMAQALRG